MRLFKKFVTKQQLKEENRMLKMMLREKERKETGIHRNERKIQKVQSMLFLSSEKSDVPEEVIKKEIAHNIAEFTQPFIYYIFEDSDDGGKICYGYLDITSKEECD